MPTPAETQFPLSISILCYCGVFLLLVISLMLFRINTRLAMLSAKPGNHSRSSKLTEADEEPQSAEVEPGTPFGEFLNEVPERRALSKKEQFKAYRKWRKEKGLNWAAKD